MNRDFAEMLKALGAENVEFLVVGAYAVAGHGIPRATGDIDLWVRPTADNAARLWRALERFGAPRSRVSPESFTQPDVVYQIGLPPNRARSERQESGSASYAVSIDSTGRWSMSTGPPSASGVASAARSQGKPPTSVLWPDTPGTGGGATGHPEGGGGGCGFIGRPAESDDSVERSGRRFLSRSSPSIIPKLSSAGYADDGRQKHP